MNKIVQEMIMDKKYDLLIRSVARSRSVQILEVFEQESITKAWEQVVSQLENEKAAEKAKNAVPEETPEESEHPELAEMRKPASEFPEDSPAYWLAMANTMVRRYLHFSIRAGHGDRSEESCGGFGSRWRECGEVRDKGHFPGRRPLGRDTWSWPPTKLALQVPAGHWPRQEAPPWCNAGVGCSKQKRSSRSNNTIRWNHRHPPRRRPRSADRFEGSVPAEHVQELERGCLPSQHCAGPH